MPGRPRPWLLIALGATVALFIATKYWPAPTLPPAPPRAQPAPPKSADNGTIDPESLKVRLEALKEPRPQPGEAERNPFRFYAKPLPPPPVNPNPQVFRPPEPTGPPPPPPIPPIPLKLTVIIPDQEQPTRNRAYLVDSKGNTFEALQGDVVDGRYKLIRVGVNDVVMSYLDGSGQRVIRQGG